MHKSTCVVTKSRIVSCFGDANSNECFAVIQSKFRYKPNLIFEKATGPLEAFESIGKSGYRHENTYISASPGTINNCKLFLLKRIENLRKYFYGW